jgi:dTDP-4-dehydrorhamnose 3,5-epimerase
MKFTPADLRDAYVIEPELILDERGFFSRSFCREEFERHGLNPNLLQCNISFNEERGTLRGLHYQQAPYAEAKLVRCTMGAIYDVILDLRPHSATFKQWTAVELTAKNRLMLYIPEGFAHGFQTLADDTEVFYQMSAVYQPDAACGIRWNDQAFAITWPIKPLIISAKDKNYPDFQ